MLKTRFLLLLSLLFLVTIQVANAQTLPTAPEFSTPPLALFIPKINKVASIVPVDITASGALGVPPNFVQAGWYDRGPVPGASGNAVIDGHVDNGASIPGVFKNLHSLVAGDDIYVTTITGAVAHYKVTSLAVYSRTAFPVSQIFAANSRSLLTLITCYGTFLPQLDTYDRRLVVTATLVG